jgi:choline dehydrogenase-like flavoprotein
MPVGAHMLRAFEGIPPHRAFEAGNVASWRELDKMFSKSVRAFIQQIVAARTGDSGYARNFADRPKTLAAIESGAVALEPASQLAQRWVDDGVLLLMHFPNPFRSDPVEAHHGSTLSIGPLCPESRGEITLRSSDPTAPPRIRANYLQTEFDRRTMIAGIGMAREVIAQEAFDPYRGRELAPGPVVETDAELVEWLRTSATTTFHPVGTCKMGNDDMAVLDARLKVRSVDRLRVADASVMPIISSGNTNAPAIMIGEKCAEFILEEAA